MIGVVLVAVLVTLVPLAMLGGWMLRQRRRLARTARDALESRVSGDRPLPENMGQPIPDVSATHLVPALATDSWRPPARQQLLRCQQEEARQRDSRAGAAWRLHDIRRRGAGIWSAAQPAPGVAADSGVDQTTPRDSRASMINNRPPAIEPAEAHSARLGRKRQGLDTLITEWPDDHPESRRED